MTDRSADELGLNAAPAAWQGQPAAAAPASPPAGATPGTPAAPFGQVVQTDAPPTRVRRHAAQQRRGGAGSLLRETVIILVSAIVLSLLVKTFLVQAFFIPSQSMHDTLIEHDRILVSKLTPGPFDLRRGDIVVFKDPGGWLGDEFVPNPGPVRSGINDVLTFIGLYPADANKHLVKRLIGLPGDRVACAGPGQPVTVNGVALKEPYLAKGAIPSEKAFDITVPPNSIWVMGDNRQFSADSRSHMGNPGGGSVPISNVVGTAFVTVWPLARFGFLHYPASTFADVPDPS